MASETTKNVKATLDEQEVTSHQRDQSAAEEEEVVVVVDPLARQSSVMSLTLEELQSSLCEPGRNFGSMNMDEFMANIWNAEEFQAATATGGCSKQEGTQREPMMPVANGTGENGGLVRQANAAAQAVVQPQTGSGGGGGGVAASGRQQVTLADMTLEDFLVKAGVVRGAFAGHGHAVVGMAPIPAGRMGIQQQHAAPTMSYQVAAPAPNAVYPVMGNGTGYHNGYPRAIAVVPPSQCVTAAVSPGSSDGVSAMTQAEMMSCIGNEGAGTVRNYGGGGGGGSARKRDSPEDACTEKTVERRQRRMIKNRESAARSRARKQAYTVELEAELNHLKEENDRLRAEQKTILLSKKKKLVEKMVEQARENVSAKKGGRGLRRSGSAMW
ncbi:ABRE binding protein [Zea mays]|uniref:Protein ABSCISIC ACID-INSENSITIVE 5 n=1 Tax=Zea mays TaxID=4577 RepID=A0A1D6N6P8_MAIZE|nr:ABRE binding protein [Zea mays]ONM36272.1 Protein ABSCISIC ACID-INSENSITIVE 5 [Zea mays]